MTRKYICLPMLMISIACSSASLFDAGKIRSASDNINTDTDADAVIVPNINESEGNQQAEDKTSTNQSTAEQPEQDSNTCYHLDILTFETLPDGSTPSDGLKIFDQFWDSHGVRFSRDDGEPLSIGMVGGKRHWSAGSLCPDCPVNGVRENENQPIGRYFLSDGAGYNDDRKSDLIIDYRNPVIVASAVLHDWDDGERWQIYAYNKHGEVIDSFDYTGTTADDNSTRQWLLKAPEGELIYQIHLRGTDVYGLGFDNFSPSKLCEKVEF